MTPAQALAILYQACGLAPLVRADAAKVEEAAQVIAKLIERLKTDGARPDGS